MGRRARPIRKWGRPCGRPHSHRRVGPEGHLTPGVFRVAAPEGGLAMSPGARAGAGSVGGRMKSEDLVQTARRFRDRSFGQVRQLVRQCGASPLHRNRPASLACRLCALAVSTGWKLRTSRRKFLAFIPPPRGISPSRRNRFQNLFFFQGVTPSIRRANPRSRCLENAPPGRVGQGQTGRLIHFRRDCQWTRVDKSTVRREREIFPVRP